MDCNREEATRARQMAETRMEKKDYVGARKVALRAKQLFPELENILQLLTVCDVHCAAEQKIIGNEMDWYGILQIEQSADEVLVKKQYRKLALLLHPDKNKFVGAEAAFKLITEAQRILLDPGKKSLHDMRRRACTRPSAPSRPPQRATKNPYGGKQPEFQNFYRSPSTPQYTSANLQHQQPQQQTEQGFSSEHGTFWAACPFCGMKHHYYIATRNKPVACHACLRPFIALDMNDQNVAAGKYGSQPAFAQKTAVPNQGAFKVGRQSNSENTNYSVKFQANLTGENVPKHSFPRTRCTSDMDKKVDKNGGSKGVNSGSKGLNSRKRRKEVSSESCDTVSSNDTEAEADFEEGADMGTGMNFGIFGDLHPRRSTRQKRKVYYNENLSDNDGMSPKKKENENGATEKQSQGVLPEGQTSKSKSDKELKDGVASTECSPKGNKEIKKVQGRQNANEGNDKRSVQDNERFKSSSSSSSTAVSDPEFYECPDPDFSDFEKDRKEACFRVGQMWAVYDTIDAMPRFYALVKKVNSSKFKLKITWLEPDPDDEEEIKWVEEGLPTSCGKFVNGNPEDTEDLLMFSHVVVWEKGSRRGTYKIYPRKGETWALFKNWDIKWNSKLLTDQKPEFEFVEVLSEYAEDVGVRVAYLGKVKGFACLFRRVVKDGKDSCLIPPNELLRFSHMVPSFQMTGKEKKGVPRGSFELDPACLPNNLEAVVGSD